MGEIVYYKEDEDFFEDAVDFLEYNGIETDNGFYAHNEVYKTFNLDNKEYILIYKFDEDDLEEYNRLMQTE